MRLLWLIVLILISMITSCKPDNNVKKPTLQNLSIQSGDHTILIFKAEQKMEIRANADTSVLTDSFSFELRRDMLPGRYQATAENEHSGIILKADNHLLSGNEHPLQIKDIRIDASPKEFPDILVPEKALLKLKSGKQTQIFIFPNDPGESGKLDPCFACPHWMAEIYAQLELSLALYR